MIRPATLRSCSTSSDARLLARFACALMLVVACGDAATSSGGGGSGGSGGSPTSTGGSGGSGGGTGASGGSGGSGGQLGPCDDPDLPFESLGNGDDPEAGDFTMQEALDGLPEGPGPLQAIIETELGTLTCELFPDAAPIGVANFVGLARGRRAHEVSNEWVRGPRFYDGLTFHRVIDNFMAQGGDPKGNGFGDPGYEFVNEVDDTSHCEPSDLDPKQPLICHVPGTLSYANAGADTNGSQFFIVAEEPQPHLDGGYTVFGRCAPVDVVQALTEVPVDGEEPIEPLHTLSVKITRGCTEE